MDENLIMEQLHELLSKCLPDKDIDIDELYDSDHLYRAYYFDYLEENDKKSFKKAWKIIPNGKKVFKRLNHIREFTWDKVINQVPNKFYKIDEKGLKLIISKNLKRIAPLILDEDYNKAIIKFLKKNPKIEKASSSEKPPAENELYMCLREAIGEALIEYMPKEEPLSLIYDWASYESDYEPTAFLLSPIMEKSKLLKEDTFDYAACLYYLKMNNRIWVKDNDFKSGVIKFLKPRKMDIINDM